ncbi:MAG: beta-galactosidase GalB [Acidobacteriota bacterium]
MTRKTGWTWIIVVVPLLLGYCAQPGQPGTQNPRQTTNFDGGWKFHLGDVADAQKPDFDDSGWRSLDLPHDWSIEGQFSESNPATPGGGALPGGIGWYRKSFTVPESDADRLVFIDFDGVYRNSEVWINGAYLGKRPYGYSSFQYELTPHLHFGGGSNVLAVKVDNSEQPNSRWYSGSGIYRNVWLVVTDKVHVDHWGTFVTTPKIETDAATVHIATTVKNGADGDQAVQLTTVLYDPAGREVSRASASQDVAAGSTAEFSQDLQVATPGLWSIDQPKLYRAVSRVECGQIQRACDEYETPFGIRDFSFDRDKGFFLNGRSMKINGVCDHHDLGCLGAAVHTRALERQLEILKGMGVNAIRTSHNPPTPELLDLCDRMGLVVMDEAFDMWKMGKTEYDYHLDWDEWHQRDLQDMVLRDRNHPSVIIWSIGNEVREQWEESGVEMARELSGIVRGLDTTRPITSAMNNPRPENSIIRSGALDLIGFNYHHQAFPNFLEEFPGQKFVATETCSALATRGSYDMPSDEVRIWPSRGGKPSTGNPDFSCSAYDNCRVPWGSTLEDTWRVIKKYDFLSGQFIWTGFDYLGEPTPYPWPARSSYFGIVDLAGFPKDSYYLFQSEWTDTPVLHVFPHWNWKSGDTVDVWAYTNCDEVELFLNGQSQGVRKRGPDDLHLMWRLKYVPGTLKAVGRLAGGETLIREIRTAGLPAALQLQTDRDRIHADGKDLSFVTVNVVDEDGTLAPRADNLVDFQIEGNGTIVGVGNGSQISHESFQAHSRKAFHGKCLVVIQSTGEPGTIQLTASAEGLPAASVSLTSF